MLTAALVIAVKSKVANSFELLETHVGPNKTFIKKHQELRKRHRQAHGYTCTPPPQPPLVSKLPTETAWTEAKGRGRLNSNAERKTV